MAEDWQQPVNSPWDPNQALLREANKMMGGRTGTDLGVERGTKLGALPVSKGMPLGCWA